MSKIESKQVNNEEDLSISELTSDAKLKASLEAKPFVANLESQPGVGMSEFTVSIDPADNHMTVNKGGYPLTKDEAFEVPIPHVVSDYYRATELKLNEIKQQSQFSDNCFTANAERLMFNFKNFGTPILLEEVIPYLNPNLPFNITKWMPNVGQLVLLGISKVSPLVLSGISKVDGPDIDKYTEPFQYFVVGVFNKEFNNRFGMKVVYSPNVNPLNPKDPNNTVSLGQQDDPFSGYNLNKTYKELKSEIAKDKDNAAKEKVYTRLIVLADEMEIKAYTY